MDTAKVFWSGRSQAVRLPREFRVQVQEMRIRRRGAALILEPVASGWDWLDALPPAPPEADFIAATSESPHPPERPDLDELMR